MPRENPGALTGYFINACRVKLGLGAVTRTSQLRTTPLGVFAQSSHTGLSEIRDQRELSTIMATMDAVNRRDLAKAMDILSMRVCALQRAKSKGGSWEKAQQIELIGTPGTDLGPVGLGALLG